MSKKKSTTKEIVHEDGVKYHATFTPTWRTELDCGDHDSVVDAQAAIDNIGRIGVHAVAFDAYWQQSENGDWIATGHDGQVETNLPIAKITRVQVAE